MMILIILRNKPSLNYAKGSILLSTEKQITSTDFSKRRKPYLLMRTNYEIKLTLMATEEGQLKACRLRATSPRAISLLSLGCVRLIIFPK